MHVVLVQGNRRVFPKDEPFTVRIKIPVAFSRVAELRASRVQQRTIRIIIERAPVLLTRL